MTSRPPPETRTSAPGSAEGAVGPPLTGMRSSHAPPRPVLQQTATSPRAGDTSAVPRAPSYIDSLPLDVLAVILEHTDSLRDIEAFCKEYPRADVALRRVHSLSLAGPDKIGPPPKPLTALRALRLAAPLRRDVTSFPIQPLECVTLDQRGAGWTSNNSLHTINALALPAVHTVRLEHASTTAVTFLTALARPVTHLTIKFDGDGTNVFLWTAGGLVRSFTHVDPAALQYIVETARADNVAHLTLSNWLPSTWAGLLLEDTPAGLFSLEIAFGEKPAFNAAHGELQSLLHYGGGAWSWCRHLHHLTLAAAGAGFEVDERDVRAFMASALGREVEVELRSVRYLGSGMTFP